jgi:hypothetical protein
LIWWLRAQQLATLRADLAGYPVSTARRRSTGSCCASDSKDPGLPKVDDAEIESQRALLRARRPLRRRSSGWTGVADRRRDGGAVARRQRAVQAGMIVISRGIVAAEVSAVTAMTCPIQTRPEPRARGPAPARGRRQRQAQLAGTARR